MLFLFFSKMDSGMPCNVMAHTGKTSLQVDTCYHFLMDIISTCALLKVIALIHTNDSQRLFLQLLSDTESLDWNTNLNASLSLLSSIRVCDSCSTSTLFLDSGHNIYISKVPLLYDFFIPTIYSTQTSIQIDAFLILLNH